MSGRGEIESRMDAVRELCRRHRVSRLQVFGSAVRDDFDPERSDFDFLVEFLPGKMRPWFGEYFDLKADLEALFGRKVDLMARSVETIENPYLRRSIERDQELLYAA